MLGLELNFNRDAERQKLEKEQKEPNNGAAHGIEGWLLERTEVQTCWQDQPKKKKIRNGLSVYNDRNTVTEAAETLKYGRKAMVNFLPMHSKQRKQMLLGQDLRS